MKIKDSRTHKEQRISWFQDSLQDSLRKGEPTTERKSDVKERKEEARPEEKNKQQVERQE